MTNILEQIIAHKKTEITVLDAQALRRAAESSPVPRDFLSAIKRLNTPLLKGEGAGVRLIAELKRASPPKGSLPHPWTSSRSQTSTLKMAHLR